jgi:hypothetical protein
VPAFGARGATLSIEYKGVVWVKEKAQAEENAGFLDKLKKLDL